MKTFQPFVYRAWVKKIDWATGAIAQDGAINDGDSGWFFLDKGNREYLNANCRLYGVNAYELNSKDQAARAKAAEGKAWLKAKIEGKQVFVLSKGLEKYGRPLLIVWLQETDFGDNAKSVNAELLKTGLAVPYMGELI